MHPILPAFIHHQFKETDGRRFFFFFLSFFLSFLNKFIWIDCNNKFGKVHSTESIKIEDITHNFNHVSLLS